MSLRTPKSILLASCAVALLLPGFSAPALSQDATALPEIRVTAASPIVRRKPALQPAGTPTPAPTATHAAADPTQQPGILPIVTDQFATITVVPTEEIRRNGGGTLGDLLNTKPGITGSSFAPNASSRPIIRGLDVNRVGIVENGIGSNGASDLGEDHFVPIDPLATNQVEVIRGPATLRYGSTSIGGVVSATNNRIPDALPPCAAAPFLRPAGEGAGLGRGAGMHECRTTHRNQLGRPRHRRRRAARCRRRQCRAACRRLWPPRWRLQRAELSLC